MSDIDKKGNPTAQFEEVCEQLRTMGFLHVCEPFVTELLFDCIEEKVFRHEKDTEVSCLGDLKQWLRDRVLEFLRIVISGSAGENTNSLQFAQWATRLEFFLFEQLALLRTKQMFDIIVDFPDTTPALCDLKRCLAKTNDRPSLIRHMNATFKRRLLHPGANTRDIITQYISTIKVLRWLDPEGVVLEAVGEPIHQYLRQRRDTVHCMVVALTQSKKEGVESGLGVLLEELKNSGHMPPVDQLGRHDDDSQSDCDSIGSPDSDWEPDPAESGPSRTILGRCAGDIFGLLIHVVGSKEIFIEEYNRMLGQRLLCNPISIFAEGQQTNYFDTVKEHTLMELLKLRFGDLIFHQCAVMLSDVDESGRVSSKIEPPDREDGDEKMELDEKSSSSRSPPIFESVIASSEFWPELSDEQFTLPPEVEKLMQNFTNRYRARTCQQDLTWRHALGAVDLELTLAGYTVKLAVSPAHAALLSFLLNHAEIHTERREWSTEEIAESVKMEESKVVTRLSFWTHRGILNAYSADGTNRYQLVGPDEEEDVYNRLCDTLVDMVDQDDDMSQPGSDDRSSNISEFERYIMQILPGSQSFPAQIIHQMLQASPSKYSRPYNHSLQELKSFLRTLMNNGRLTVDSDGNYTRTHQHSE
eukprot:754973_1